MGEFGGDDQCNCGVGARAARAAQTDALQRCERKERNERSDVCIATPQRCRLAAATAAA